MLKRGDEVGGETTQGSLESQNNIEYFYPSDGFWRPEVLKLLLVLSE